MFCAWIEQCCVVILAGSWAPQVACSLSPDGMWEIVGKVKAQELMGSDYSVKQKLCAQAEQNKELIYYFPLALFSSTPSKAELITSQQFLGNKMLSLFMYLWSSFFTSDFIAEYDVVWCECGHSFDQFGPTLSAGSHSSSWCTQRRRKVFGLVQALLSSDWNIGVLSALFSSQIQNTATCEVWEENNSILAKW